MSGQEQTAHFLRRENFDLRVRLLESLTQLGGGLAVRMEVTLLFGEGEHGDQIAPDRIPAHRPETVEAGQEAIDIDCRDVGDVSPDTVCELLEVQACHADVGIAHPAGLTRGDKLIGNLGDTANGDNIGSIRGIKPDGIR